MKGKNKIIIISLAFLLFFLFQNKLYAQSCLNNCGGGVGWCNCDDNCWVYMDCCSDICTYCSTYSSTMTANCSPSSGCLSCPNYNFGVMYPSSTWLTHSSNIGANQCKIYKFALTAGITYYFSLCPANGGSAGFDSILDLLGPACSAVANNDDECALQSYIQYTPGVSGFYYLKVRGYSSGNGNFTLAYSSNETPKTLNVRLFLEGLYDENSGIMNTAKDFVSGSIVDKFGPGIADVVTIELCESNQPFSTVYSFQDVIMNTDGALSIPAIPNSVSGSYYLVIKHRNSIETWSALPFSFAGSGPFSYDFTTSAVQAYGNNLKPVAGGLFAIWGANANIDFIIDIDDMSLIDNASLVPVLNGYYPQDIDGDGIVDVDDMTIIENNSLPPSVSVKKP